MHHKILMVTLVLTFIITSSTSTLAAQSSEKEREKYNQVMEEYGLKMVEEIPDGVTPIEVSSPEELDALFRKIEDDLRNSTSTVSEAIEDTPLEQPETRATAYTTVNRNCSVALGGLTNPYFNTYGTIRVGTVDSSWRWIDSASASVGLSGVTTGVSLSDPWTQADINSNQTSVYISGGGTLNYYVLTPIGPVTFSSEPISCSLTYSVY